MNIAIITSMIGSAAGFALAWQLQAGNISELKLGHTNERSAVNESIRTALEANTRQVAAAQAASARRNVRVRVDSDQSSTSGDGLRDASAATTRTSEDYTDACRAIVSAYDTVVAASSGFIQEVARDADQCHSDLQLMQEAWPK